MCIGGLGEYRAAAAELSVLPGYPPGSPLSNNIAREPRSQGGNIITLSQETPHARRS